MKSVLGLLLCVALTRATDRVVRVDTAYGPVDGRTFQLHTGEDINAFLSIPYATPPLADRRWTPPDKPLPWSTPLDAATLGPACIQQAINDIQVTHPGWSDYSEDCLHLSIYAPADLTQGPYPVMVWIHGGANKVGSSIMYPGYFLAAKDVVVVVPNYRLNIFGYGSTRDGVAPGNYGLLDQIHALEFVQENIQAFGGDPERVTIAGNSAGGVNTGLLQLSPLTERLFHQAILQSGTEFAPWALSPEDDENYMLQVGEQLDCPVEDTQDMMDCLRTKNAQRLLRAEVICVPGVLYDCHMQPVVDGLVLEDSPRNTRNSRVIKMPELIGINSEDGFLFMAANTWLGLNRTEFEDYFRDYVTSLAPNFEDPDRVEDVVQALLFQYTPWPTVHDAKLNRDAIGRAQTDYGFGAPADMVAKIHSRDNDVFFYVFSHRPNDTVVAPWRGSMHAMELEFMFGYPLLQFNDDVYNHTGFGKNVDYADSDVAMAELMITLWTNFVKFGSPTPSPVPGPTGSEVTWPGFSESDLQYLWLGTEEVEARKDYRQEYYAFFEYYTRYLTQGERMP